MESSPSRAGYPQKIAVSPSLGGWSLMGEFRSFFPKWLDGVIFKSAQSRLPFFSRVAWRTVPFIFVSKMRSFLLFRGMFLVKMCLAVITRPLLRMMPVPWLDRNPPFLNECCASILTIHGSVCLWMVENRGASALRYCWLSLFPCS